MAYREFNDADYTNLRKDLIREKGSELQKEFLHILKDSNQFTAWLEERVKIEEEGVDFDLVVDALSENEFKDLPALMEKELFGKWKAITPAQACRATFWGYMTLRHIKESKISSYYLAAKGGTLPGGLERIDAALRDGGAKGIDDIVRTALRRLSGLPGVRGNRTVYTDCTFARAWWRGHITREICEETPAAAEKITEILRVNQTYWENFINPAVSKNSVFGDTKIRASLIWALSDLLDDENKKPLFVAKNLEKIIKRVGVRLAWQELAVFPSKELKALFEKEFLAGFTD